MGYGYYVIDGKECGYGVEAICEHEGCTEAIDRGVAFACGGEPGEGENYCAGYFCADHLSFTAYGQLCDTCDGALVECSDCEGTGWVGEPVQPGVPQCPACDGYGSRCDEESED